MQLFLDADPKRAAVAFQRMSEEEQQTTIWCRTVVEAQTTLYNYRKDLTHATLEHDLDGRPYANTKDDTCGMELVRWLENTFKYYRHEFEDIKKIQFTIHTYNDHAGPIMVKRMKELGLDVNWKPFGT